MFKIGSFPKSRILLISISVLLSILALAGSTLIGRAHCDSTNGPVVTAAAQALEAGNVDLVLPYVKAEYEAEVIAAFEQTLEVRALGPSAQALADNYFFETVVRLHRAGEGAPYTGLKEEEIPPAILAADEAMETGSMEGVMEFLNEALEHELEAKYEAVKDTRQEAEKRGTVEANRERVEAELAFETYVYELYLTITSAEAH